MSRSQEEGGNRKSRLHRRIRSEIRSGRTQQVAEMMVAMSFLDVGGGGGVCNGLGNARGFAW